MTFSLIKQILITKITKKARLGINSKSNVLYILSHFRLNQIKKKKN
jgi:hypothetical protein